MERVDLHPEESGMRGLRLLWVLVLVTETGSQTVLALDDDSFAYEIPPGSTVVLRQALDVPAGKAAAYLQNGRQIGKYEGDRYLPACRFRITGGKNKPRVIEPDTFRVTRVRPGYEIVGLPPSWQVTGLMRVGDDPSYEIYSVNLELKSADQPAVWRLSCEKFYAFGEIFPTDISLGQVKQAVGGVVQIRLAE
jgi:hypothetical protein